MDENKDIQELIEMLKSNKASMRFRACEILGVAPSITQEAIDALRNALNDSVTWVAESAKKALANHISHEPSSKALSPEPLADAPMPSSSSQGIDMTTPELIQQNQLGLRREEHDWFQKWFEQITSRQIQLIQDLNQDLNQEIKVLNSIKSAVWIIVIILVLTGIFMFINAVAIQVQGYGIF